MLLLPPELPALPVTLLRRCIGSTAGICSCWVLLLSCKHGCSSGSAAAAAKALGDGMPVTAAKPHSAGVQSA
jgi:hypothetical protein